jgi:hypothetical protein
MDAYKISRLTVLLLAAGMLAIIITAKATSETPDVQAADTPGVLVSQPQTSMSSDNLSDDDPVPDTVGIVADDTGATPPEVPHQAGECSKYQAAFLEAECTALRNTLILRLFLALR